MLLGTLALAPLLPLAGALRSANGELPSEVGIAPKRVAVIGAGAAGASTAYHLAQNAQNASIPTRIHVYERSSRAGGRSTTVNAWSDPSQPIELGASIFVSVNHILVAASKAFNLTSANEQSYAHEDIPELGVWNGEEFVFVMEGDGSWWDIAKLVWRYGYAPIKTNALMKKTVGKFMRMYEEPVFPWKSLSDVVAEVGLVGTTGVTGEQFLKEEGVSDKFANEIVQASTRVNYASNLATIHGLETMVCMAANGAMSIAGGNWKIFDKMLQSSPSISTHLNTSITHISKQPDKTYNITISSGEITQYDEVILASPLQFSKLIIGPPPQHTPDQIPYVKLHVTLFASPHRLSPASFGLADDKRVPQHVLTTLHPSEKDASDSESGPGFNSISIVASGTNNLASPPRPEYIYKIFSFHPIDAAFLSRYLGQPVSDDEAETGDPDGHVSWVYRKVWHSYPKELPRITFDEIVLDEGLWYTSGIEPFISTMETSALMGKNVARLVVDGWVGKADGREPVLKDQDWEDWRFEGAKEEGQKPLKARL
ncbi:Prenylcysteine oxidase [Lentithecium fluviatile CBS 122367]|uniref:Prenylcysteine oxidase n=1 Tax=Lentithecium fluviatile CBS 122367 TaxID=1168545 RepID=A0A6G1J763_9PLEO|nr:Prenylcysteine oxidase [Lentithecium fluviatile CBS 122367]